MRRNLALEIEVNLNKHKLEEKKHLKRPDKVNPI